jgi:hypothetical protein
MRLLAIDPGKNTGWALFEHGEFSECGVFDTSAETLGKRCAIVAAFVRRWFPHMVAAEVPQVYIARKSVGDPNDLIPLACLAGAAASAAERSALVLPRQWKGTVPKPPQARWESYVIHKRNLARLQGGEARRYAQGAGKSLDAIDAVGLGLWVLGTPAGRRA